MKDRSGQATTEYILMLMVGMSLFLALVKNVIRPTYARLQSVMIGRLEAAFFGKDNFHRFPVRGGK
jgi:hypothetical protein